MDVLVVGGGGREHALAWKLKQSPRIGKLYIAPGNGGTHSLGENVPIGVMEFERLAEFAEEKNIHLTVVGPDDPLGGGIVDVFRARGLSVCGPSKAAARIEASKAFAKELMVAAKIPTADFKTFTDYEAAVAYLADKKFPVVIKASGLALGKGVIVCNLINEAQEALHKIMVEKIFKESGNEVVIEELLGGYEFTVQAFCSGTSYKLLPSAQDHKRIFDNDMGPNTGGMGVIAPVPLPFVRPALMNEVEEKIVKPVLAELERRGHPFTGCLYVGVMDTGSGGPKVIEFNARFGDPEAQVYMRLLKTDVLDIFEACVDGKLAEQPIEWHSGYAVNIVIASGGYPGEYKKGLPITGIEEAEKVEGVVVFHAGTVFDGALKTSGGRVLGVSAVGNTLQDALDRAYEAVEKIHFDGMHFRRDIGAKALVQK